MDTTAREAQPDLDLRRIEAYLVQALSGLSQEYGLFLFLDQAWNPIGLMIAGQRRRDHVILPLDQVLGAGKAMGADALILVHNHPSGTLQPSAADIVATRFIEPRARAIGIALVDHWLVADGRSRSILCMKPPAGRTASSRQS